MNLNLTRKNNIVSGDITLSNQELNELSTTEIKNLESKDFSRTAAQIKNLSENPDKKHLEELFILIRNAFIGIVRSNMNIDESIPIVIDFDNITKNDSNKITLELKAWICPDFNLPDLNLLRIDPASLRVSPNIAIGEAFKFIYNESKFEIPDFVIQNYIKLFKLIGENKIVTDSFAIDTGLFLGYGGPLQPEGNQQLEELAERYIKTVCIVIRLSRLLKIEPDEDVMQNYEKSVLEVTRLKLKRPNLISEDIIFFPDSYRLTVQLEEIINYVLNYALRHA